MTKRFLSLHRHSPGIRAKEALDAVLVAGVFDQQVSLLFREKGVLQLVAAELTDEMAEAIRSLPVYGIDAIYVCRDALRASDLTPESLLIPVQAVSAAEQAELLAQQDMVLCD